MTVTFSKSIYFQFTPIVNLPKV